MSQESKCRSCDAPIVWMKTKAGKNMPVNLPPIASGESANEAILTAAEFDPSYMISHFSTCPQSKSWRQEKPKQSRIEKSMSKYPRMVSIPRLLKPTSQAICWICGARALYQVEIQVNWFRGDDEVLKACEAHKRSVEKE